ncbi:MAG TPA: hypothetical protein VMH03_21865 [Terriglobales bacterium]|nr:hypothetical protein [Terriglobales bacterium]
MLALLVLLLGHGLAQTTNGSTSDSDEATAKQWSFSLSTFGYLVPQDQSYGSPIFTADHRWLHLEARYNYEDQETGSLWAGYNLSVGDRLVFEATPMLGAVFGNTTGIAPGCELALSYKKIELSTESEYVYDPSDSKSSFFYSWNELVYSPTDWFHAGLVAQRTRAYHTPLDVQRGFSVGFAHKNLDFTTYVFNAGWTDPTVVLALGFTF